MMDMHDLRSAKESLRVREDIPEKNIQWIGVWERLMDPPQNVIGLPLWAEAHGIDAVIWTDLPAKFGGKGKVAPTLEQAVAYLDNLRGGERDLAEQYVRRAPKQIDTIYRRAFEAAFGWTFSE